MTCLARQGRFALAVWEGRSGWVPIVFTRPVEEEGTWAVTCDEFLNLRPSPGSFDSLDKLRDQEPLTLLGWEGRYARVSGKGREGYVLSGYIRPMDPDYFEKLLSAVTPTERYSYGDLLADLEDLQQAYPQWVRVENAGTSEEGRDIPVLILGDPDAPRQILLQGGIHGREYAGSWLLMALAEDALRSRSFDPTETAFHILPMVNPDGVTISQRGTTDDPETVGLWQANSQGVDLNRNFPTDWDALPTDRPE